MSDLPAVQNTTGAAAAALLKSNKVAPTVAGGNPYLKFDAKRTGEWLLGAENEVCTGDVISIDVGSLTHGYVLWHMKKRDGRMVPINQPLPLPQEPIHYEIKGHPAVDEPNEARAFNATFEDGTVCAFEASTFGSRVAVDELLAELFVRAGADSPYLFPQVKLGNDHYDHDQYGKVYTPVLTPVTWFDDQGNEEGAKLAAPAEPEPTPELEEEAPKPRRRRRAAA